MTSTNQFRLSALRTLLTEKGGDGFLVPHTDAYQGEYVASCDERLAWLTGFTGSAGVAIVLKDKAALFVDGRYTLQALSQVDTALYEICSFDLPPYTWLKQNLKKGQKVLYDPWLHSLNEINQGKKACEFVGGQLVPILRNLIDHLWADRPTPPLNSIYPHGIQYAGISSEEKRQAIANKVCNERANAVLLTAPESIAWLLNIRGSDVPCTPIAHGFAILWKDASVDLFMHSAKISSDMKKSLGSEVRHHDLEILEHWLERLKDLAILIDPTRVPIACVAKLQGCHLIHAPDPCALPKSIKNKIEAEGARQAHHVDGLAVTRFLAWLSYAVPKDKVTELDAAEKLLTFRQENNLFQGVSFETISSFGSNGAVVHYRVRPETNRLLELNSLYLVDSGGQYLNGTTDITRTIALGLPTPEQKDRFTRVLKGHIALAMAHFPAGTTGGQLDILARQFLWQAGLDYDHGTGHGVGSFLSVHEGPQRISKAPSSVALKPGMIISNEPGYYKANDYGIRIESLIIVVEKGIPSGGDRTLLGFETLTLVPIDTTLVEKELLTQQERGWLNAYHSRVREALLSHLNAEEAEWIKRATKAV